MIQGCNSMALSPTASVFIPTYNHAPYLSQCLDSILAQTFQDFEVVIVDDGSTDNSLEILNDYQRRFPAKVHFHWHSGHANKGVAATSNLAITKSRGKYLAWTGSDDVWYPDKLELQIAQLENDPRLGMVYSFADFIDGDGKLLPGMAGLDITSDANPVGRILRYCYPPAMTTVIRRECLDSVGLCDETLPACEDWDLWIRIFSHYKVGFLERSLAKYRLHNYNMSKGNDPKVSLNRILAMYDRIEQKLNDIGGTLLDARNQAILDLQLAFHLFSADRMEEAKRYLHSAFQKDPSLLEDGLFFNDWLNQWKPEFYTVDQKHFGFWVIQQMPPTIKAAFRDGLLERQLNNPDTKAFFIQRGIQWGKLSSSPVNMTRIFKDCPDEFPLPRSWKADVLKEVYPALLFESYKKREISKIRYYWQKTVQSNPAKLGNRGILAIGLKTFLRRRRGFSTRGPL